MVRSTKLGLIAITCLCAGMAQAQSDQKAIKAMFQKQASAMGTGNIAAYMSTIDTTIPAYSQTETMMRKLFSVYKLKATIERLKVGPIKGTTAQVEMVLLTKKVSGPAFKNNRTTITSLVNKRSGKWVTSDSKIDKIEYLK